MELEIHWTTSQPTPLERKTQARSPLEVGSGLPDRYQPYQPRPQNRQGVRGMCYHFQGLSPRKVASFCVTHPPTPLYYFKVWPPILSPDQMRFN